MIDRVREDLENRTRRFEIDAVVSLIVGLVCCSPAGLFLAIRAMNGARDLLIELQSSGVSQDLESRVSTARTIATVATGISGIFAAIVVWRTVVFLAVQ